MDKALIMLLLSALGAVAQPWRPQGFTTNSVGQAIDAQGSDITGIDYLSATTINATGATNVLGQRIIWPFGVLSPTSQDTNYTFSLLGSTNQLFSANTNANVSLADIQSGLSATLFVNAITSSASCVVTLPANLITNSSMMLTVTGGTLRVYNFYSIDGTTTNIVATSGDFYQR